MGAETKPLHVSRARARAIKFDFSVMSNFHSSDYERRSFRHRHLDTIFPVRNLAQTLHAHRKYVAALELLECLTFLHQGSPAEETQRIIDVMALLADSLRE